MKISRRLLTGSILAALLFWSAEDRCLGWSWDEDPALGEYFSDVFNLAVPLTPREKVFKPEDGQAGFTTFEGAEQVAVRDGVLSFVTANEVVTLGWGNYLGQQPLDEIADLWETYNEIVLRVKASTPKTSWSAQPWADGSVILGKKRSKIEAKAETEGTEWQDLRLTLRCVPNPDGFEFTVTAPTGTRVAIQGIKFVQPCHEGVVRKAFELPRGKIWRAMADVPNANENIWGRTAPIHTTLYINGQKVERQRASLYETRPVDITPYLQPGRNCIGLYGFRILHDPPLLCRATIIMSSGEIIRLNTDTSWTVNGTVEPGWNEPGFDDSGWKAAERGGTGYTRHFQLMPPSHAGYLVISNPFKRDLVYADMRSIILNVAVPRALASQSPAVKYRFGKADKDGLTTVSKEDTVDFFDYSGGSLVYRLDLGRHPRGIYTVALRLVAEDGTVLDERPREALVVLRKKQLRPIRSTDYMSELDVELEDRIDFTDPDDPHEWIEGNVVARGKPVEAVQKPRVVRQDGLVYREVVGEKANSHFSYRLGEFEHPGDFYLFELEYPDNAYRLMGAAIANVEAGRTYDDSESGVGAETGGKFYTTGKMLTLRWVQIADEGINSISIIHEGRGAPAAAASLKVYHVKGDLPSAGSGEGRRYGIYTERSYITAGFAKHFGRNNARMLKQRKDDDFMALPLMQRYIMDMAWMEETCEKFVQYMRFAGHNMHLMGCIQYHLGNSPYIPADITPRVMRCPRTLLANVMNMNGVDIVANLQFSQSGVVRTFNNNAQVARGADSMWRIDENGHQIYGITGTTVIPNWQYPGWQRMYRRTVDNMVNTFGDLEHFLGISQLIGAVQWAYYYPGYGDGTQWDKPLLTSYDDITFSRFEQATGIDLGIDSDDPGRFNKRASILRTSPDLRETFLAWRGASLRDFMSGTVAQMRARNRRLRLLSMPCNTPEEMYRHLISEDIGYGDLLQRFGIDLKLLGAIEHHIPVRWTISWRGGGVQNPYLWIPKEREIVTSAFADLPRRAVFCRTSWIENALFIPGDLQLGEGQGPGPMHGDWFISSPQKTVEPQPAGYHAREAFIQAIITADPQFVFGGFCDHALNLGHEDVVREVMRLYTRLPEANFDTVLDTGLESNLAIRKLNRKDASWLYVANPGYWHIKGTVTINAGGPVMDLATEREVAKAGQTDIDVELGPYGLAAYRVASAKLEIASFQTGRISKREIRHMTHALDRAELLLGKSQVAIVLPQTDRAFMRETITAARADLKAGRYAHAWSMIKHYRFWDNWKEYLERANEAMAFLPESLPVAEPPDDLSAVREITASRAKKPVSVDGNLDEAVWQQGKFSAGFRTKKDGKMAMNQTAVKAAYDDEALYLAFVCADRDTQKLKATAKDEMTIWAARDDVLITFVQPDASLPVYYQMAFNPAGIHFDQRVKGEERDYDFDPDWETATAKAEAHWTAEVRLPFKAFGLDGKGDANWRINFFRVMRNRELDHAEWSLHKAKWHDPRYFGKMTFAP